jgi:hypothetical protein
MICHVCEQPASGQCQACGKFYCPQHGDMRCIRCVKMKFQGREETEERIQAAAAPASHQNDVAEPNPFRSQVLCRSCGLPYSNKWNREGALFVPRGWCSKCAVELEKRWAIIARLTLVVVIFLVGYFLALYAFQ